MSEPITLSPNEAAWLLEAIDIALDEGWPRGPVPTYGETDLTPSQEGDLVARLGTVAGVTDETIRNCFWLIGRDLGEQWPTSAGGSKP